MQAALPATALNLPVAHCEHGPPLLPVAPALQAQSVAALLAASECECVGHAWQVADDVAPMVGENLPAAQLVQAPPVAANLPAAQLVQLLAESDPAGEDLPAAQLVHEEAEEAPMSAENVPAPQSLHAASPTEALKVPAAHAWHAPPEVLE